MYSLILKAHVALVLLSFISFLLRAMWGFNASALIENKFALAMHKLLTLMMLTSAVLLCVTIRQYPFVDPWLTEKFMLLLAYVGSAMLVFRPNQSRKSRAILTSLTCVIFISIFVIGKLHAPIALG
ncbi:SirB2 family protein [Vibrio nomapromontoriensis]|uniref:SirB2 family protein n=1 Tax=Vibrio nomapromontoriensis TaxID=2910246 RepID=UPI003D09FC59